MRNIVGGSFLVLIGVVCFYFSFCWLAQEVLLDVTGQSTNGLVTEKTTSTDEDYNVSYYISYSYEDSAQNQYSSSSDVFKSMYDDYPQGTQVPVVYSSTIPSISRLRSTGEYLLPSGLLGVLGGLALWLGLRVLLRQIYWDNKQARLMKDGDRRVGRLVAVEEDKTGEEEDYIPLVLVYVFTDKTGLERTGKTFHVEAGDHAFWKGRVGCALDVRVNPADPTDHIALVEESKLLK